MIDYNKLTDKDLTVLLADGDQCAYTEIFERYKLILYKHAYRLLNDQEETNDVIQDLFFTLWQKRESMIFKTSLSAYLYNAVRNRVFDLISHQKVVTRYVESIRDFITQGEYIVDEQIRTNELIRIIEKQIAALPPKMRAVFELSRQNDLSYKQIGQQLNISDKTVRQQVHNAVKILRLKLSSIATALLFF